MSTQQDYWLRKIEGDLAAICDGDEDEVAERMAKIEGVPFQKTSRENVPRRNVFSSREISKATAPPEQQAFALWDCYTSLLAKVGGQRAGHYRRAAVRSRQRNVCHGEGGARRQRRQRQPGSGPHSISWRAEFG
jgi:hypothetical protein